LGTPFGTGRNFPNERRVHTGADNRRLAQGYLASLFQWRVKTPSLALGKIPSVPKDRPKDRRPRKDPCPFCIAPRRCHAIGMVRYSGLPGHNGPIKLCTFSHHRKGGRLSSTSSLYVYAFSPPTCESQYVVGSVKNSPSLQRWRIASSLTLIPRPGPVGTGM
jgi:hypothetical protein